MLEGFIHESLIIYPSVLQTERHNFLTVINMFGDKGNFLIEMIHEYLIKPIVHV